MEPTIYKPSIYKGPGIYKGAGGIYKGRGVYNDGANKLKIWELDIQNLVLSNHTDIYGMSHKFSGPVTKIDNNTKLKFGTNAFAYVVDQLSKLGDLKKIEIKVSQITIGNYAFVGACRSFIRSSFDYTRFGPWNAYRYPNGEHWNFLKGTYFGYTNESPYYYIGYQGLTISMPLIITLEFSDKVKQYFNNELVAEKLNDYDNMPENENWTRFSINSANYSGTTIILDSLKVWYE